MTDKERRYGEHNIGMLGVAGAGYESITKAWKEAQEKDAEWLKPGPKDSTAELMETHHELTQKARDLMRSKNHDYRGGADSDPYANFRGSDQLGIHPVVGILLRMQDKIMRVKTFAEKGQLMVKGEGIDDALIDIINYAVLIKGMIDFDSKIEPF